RVLPTHTRPLQGSSTHRVFGRRPAEERGRQDPEAHPSRAILGDSRTGGELMEPGVVTVQGNAIAYVQEITVGRHRFTGDMPAAAGGTDSGPEPYDFLLASLGSCISITVAMYARRKQWPLDGVLVQLRHSRVYAADCEQCETTSGLLDRIDCDVE